MSTAFKTRGLTVQYQGAPAPALVDITIDIPRGSFVGVIGPNGSGKSTLLRALLGALPDTKGAVWYDERLIEDWPRRELARRIGAVTQIEELTFPVTVYELVSMGRYPHLGALGRETSKDVAAIERAMQRAHVAQFAERLVTSLSGGERQRARIARALAQDPTTLVLDEPTVALDIAHEMTVFELLRSLTRNEGCTVVVATHHINLASRYADVLLLLDRGRSAAIGDARAVMRKEILEQVYGWPLLIHDHPGSGFDRGAPQIAPLSST